MHSDESFSTRLITENKVISKLSIPWYTHFTCTRCIIEIVIHSNNDKRVQRIVNIMTPGAGVLMLSHGHISHIVKTHHFFKNH